MAAAQVARALSILDAQSSAAEIRVGIHDASRLEWSASLPLPEGRRAVKYELEAVLQIPSNAFAKHAPWDQLQSFTRLDGPAEPVRRGDPVTIDALRRRAVSLAASLTRASDGFARDSRLAASIIHKAPPVDLEERLRGWTESAASLMEEARRIFAVHEGDPAELGRERRLADEYASVRLLEFLAGVERSLASMLDSRAPHVERFRELVESLEAEVGDALALELGHREREGYVRADAGSQVQLERYLDRASQLKKHFQEVLFLEAERFLVTERVHHWAAGLAALVASSWAFAAQVFLLAQPASATTTIGSGLLLLGVLGGVVYVVKDRLKELGRSWLSGQVGRYYAQRVAKYRAPSRRLPSRDVIVSARESFDQQMHSQPDPLNPESGARVTATVLRYSHKGQVAPQATLTSQGVRGIKHVFRYDLSPLFARLDDSTKQVPVLEPSSRRVRFVDAPRCYRLPVRLALTCDGVRTEESVTLVVHKRGLARIERESDAAALEASWTPEPDVPDDPPSVRDLAEAAGAD